MLARLDVSSKYEEGADQAVWCHIWLREPDSEVRPRVLVEVPGGATIAPGDALDTAVLLHPCE